MLGAYKKHPQAYLLYVEDCFLLSDNADARLYAKEVRLDVWVKDSSGIHAASENISFFCK